MKEEYANLLLINTFTGTKIFKAYNQLLNLIPLTDEKPFSSCCAGAPSLCSRKGQSAAAPCAGKHCPESTSWSEMFFKNM